MFYVFAAILLAIVLGLWSARRPRMAVMVCCGAAILGPTWIYQEFGPLKVDLRTFGAATALAILGTASGRFLPRRWTLCDGLVIGIMLSQLTAEYINGEMSLSMFLPFGYEWYLPYWVGRMVFDEPENVEQFTRVAIWACLVLAVWTGIESITHVNPVGLIIEHVGSFNAESNPRWGLRRAEGPTNHPIYLGMIFVMLLPWLLHAAGQARLRLAPSWWRAAPWFVGMGVFFTMSRAPQIAVLLVLYLTALFVLPKWRKTMVAVGVGCALVVLVGRNEVVEGLHAWSDEDPHDALPIDINGATYLYTGTNHRYLQLLVFEKAALEAGLFGYGRARVTASPPEVPIPDNLPPVFHSIDNHYLFENLRSGYMGVGLLCLLGLVAGARLLPVALSQDSNQSLLAAAQLAALIAMMLGFTMVYMAPDFGFFWFFNIGFAADARKATAAGRLAPRPAPPPRQRRRLVAGPPDLGLQFHSCAGSTSSSREL